MKLAKVENSQETIGQNADRLLHKLAVKRGFSANESTELVNRVRAYIRSDNYPEAYKILNRLSDS
ncbi:hypothetical protein kac65v162_gp027 [Nodularia phage vB_NspS-kac65v162]|jgi:hypothetical protein|uniref:Uncharacterized protein n=6 Tax=Ravarandavirus TaxID=2843444 RepID=A0A482MJS2_9CAUD|nr:hypothetical protein HWA92_gp025 [Nodularia phage vB_NpeS-2AV2]YP_009844630.1 hypothetical protein HWC12_gp027 [Nodularia phage vB_NspS-kac65v151]YP_009844840.1 hypothetical protein HWC13_gp031 [Nodularia phage vB_NspS-kac68v161]QBQ73265.1 hypothetical protein kac65v161_gp027 [Nodularia phage vB_NspS-kac65v161]QBQ73471.1 hypothetical protein kac65v162_gp027 [Nodularia phage vB_NspS-kac65v162]QBQ73879.1 hypothetical protein kac68v162_gp031 [Nodularia phage vB_NspS-kac68v162]ALY07477.1 hypot